MKYQLVMFLNFWTTCLKKSHCPNHFWKDEKFDFLPPCFVLVLICQSLIWNCMYYLGETLFWPNFRLSFDINSVYTLAYIEPKTLTYNWFGLCILTFLFSEDSNYTDFGQGFFDRSHILLDNFVRFLGYNLT